MSEDLQQPEQLQAPEVDIDTLAAAKERIESGIATDEDKAMVAGFEAGAAAAHELRSVEDRTQVPNLLDPTKKRIEDLQAVVDTEKAWGEDTSSNETALQGHKDMRDYLEGRDYTDRKGSIHDADSGKFVSKDDANGGATDKADLLFETSQDAEDEYASLSIDELVTKWAEAEDNNDKTTSLNVQDALQAHLVAERENADSQSVADDYEGTKGLSDEHALQLIDRMHDMMLARRKNTNVSVEAETDEEQKTVQATEPEAQKSITIEHDDANDSESVVVHVNPERKAIEAVPERPAIEAAPEKKAIEAAPKTEEPLPELSYQVGMVKNSLKHVAEAAVDRVEAEKEAMASMGRIRRFFNGLKFSTLLKRETERKRGEEIMEPLTEVVREDGVFGVAEYLGRIHGKGVADARAQERAMLEVLLDDELQRAGDVVLDGANGEDDPLIAEIRGRSKEILLAYLDESSAEGITDDDRAELVAVYEWDMQQLVKDMLEAHPDQFNKEAFAAMADNSLELMEQSRLYLRHEDGRQRLEAMLDSMKISVGQVQVGPNSSYDTTYIEGTLEQLRRRRVGSVVGRLSFVAGTWATGALAAGALEQLSQSVSTSGARYGAAAVGGVLLGPVGAVAGYGAGVAASAFWGRRLARNRAMETVAMMEVKSGDSGTLEQTELFRQLAQDTISYTETTTALGTYLDTSGETPVLRSDLSPTDIQNLIQGLSEVSVRFGVERAINSSAQQDTNEREINLFMATDASTVQVERNQLIQLTQLLRAELDRTVGESGITINDQSISLEQALATAEAASATSLSAHMQAVAERRDTFVRQQGRRGAIVAGTLSGVFGIAGAAAAEALTHGGATTILDTIGARGNTVSSTIQQVKVGNLTTQFNTPNGAHVNILAGGKQLEVTTATGTQHVFTLDSHHHLTAADTATLKSEGVTVTASASKIPTGPRVVDTNTFLKNHGGHQMKVSGWEMNGTQKPDGTELGTHLFHAKNGDWVITQDQGTAFGSGKSYNMLAQAQKGELYAYITNHGMSVPLKMHVAPNGHIEVRIPQNSPLHSMFYTQKGGHIQFRGSMWRIGVPTSQNSYDSISSMHGDGLSKIKIPGSGSATLLKVDFGIPQETGFTIPGVAFSGDHGQLYRSGDQSEPTPEPTPPTPDLGGAEPQEPKKDTEPLQGIVVEPTVDNATVPLQPPAELEGSGATPELPPAPAPALEQKEVLQDAVQAQPLSSKEIIDRLTNQVPKGLKVEISGQVLDVERVALTDGAPRLIMRKADGTEDFIELENLDRAIQDGKVRFNKYLGTPDAGSIVNDIRVGELLNDSEYGTIRITRVNDTGNGVAFEQLDDQGNPILREADSNPRFFTPDTLKARIEQGITTPSEYRGVQIA